MQSQPAAALTFVQYIPYAWPAVCAIAGWFMREMWTAMQKLKDDFSVLEKQLPLNYVQKDDYKDDMKTVMEKLDRIYDKIDGKADKAR